MGPVLLIHLKAFSNITLKHLNKSFWDWSRNYIYSHLGKKVYFLFLFFFNLKYMWIWRTQKYQTILFLWSWTEFPKEKPKCHLNRSRGWKPPSTNQLITKGKKCRNGWWGSNTESKGGRATRDPRQWTLSGYMNVQAMGNQSQRSPTSHLASCKCCKLKSSWALINRSSLDRVSTSFLTLLCWYDSTPPKLGHL